jgi:hypothetical protein
VGEFVRSRGLERASEALAGWASRGAHPEAGDGCLDEEMEKLEKAQQKD